MADTNTTRAEDDRKRRELTRIERRLSGPLRDGDVRHGHARSQREQPPQRRPPDVAVHVVRELVRDDDFDFVHCQRLEQRIGQDDAAGPPDAAQRRVGAA